MVVMAKTKSSVSAKNEIIYPNLYIGGKKAKESGL